ncbi:hypothetical protein RHGRI_000965 [Rhododendron griersonianum]|uniref:t-SNARE coiled-coil homology domain-containing protein n=1 Tax=Rhododendron griersonianum TaxID=479676 RepID=A0AAV6LIY2_9ERIC|nr:hypothetical protein RHGRI_000965 [Rhododendron griersonianum]
MQSSDVTYTLSEAHKPDGEDVFMEEDIAPKALDQETKDEDGGWTEVKDTDKEEHAADDDKEEILPDETIHETAVGKGLSGALKLLKDRGTLKETVEWGGRNMDKKKSKLVGIYENDGQKEIRIERLDEFGRILTPKEAFRLISHKFHGKGPGKTKQEKRIREYHEELKVKQMKNSDTPSESVERMREAQARLKTPYLVLSGNVKPGQTSDPSSGFATVEKDLPGGLTPMLGDRKVSVAFCFVYFFLVEHFLGIKRKGEPGDMGPPKKPKMDHRNNRVALFDGIEEGGIRASSSYASPEIDEHDNDRAMDGLQDRVIMLKRLTGDIHEEVEGHNRMLDRMGNEMDSSRGVLSGTMDKFKMVFETKSSRRTFSLVAAFVVIFLIIYYLTR